MAVKLTSPCFTMSVKSNVVNVFVIEPISKNVFWFTGILLAVDIFPRLNMRVPLGSTNPMTMACFRFVNYLIEDKTLYLSWY